MDFVGGAFDAMDHHHDATPEPDELFPLELASLRMASPREVMRAPAAKAAPETTAQALPRTLSPPRAAPSGRLPPDLEAKMIAAAAREGGTLRRGPWIAVTDFAAAWRTAFFEVAPLPDTVVCRVDEFREYAWALHRRLAAAYKWHDIAMPQWRSWDALVRRWPPLAEQPAHHLPLRRVRIVRAVPVV